jgi:hypothetical protein
MLANTFFRCDINESVLISAMISDPSHPKPVIEGALQIDGVKVLTAV